ncbi:MAG: hypothetical protein C0501_11080 [Isosphaera sp.]|nr:hypothetical protein [Isosphaera sp.]
MRCVFAAAVVGTVTAAAGCGGKPDTPPPPPVTPTTARTGPPAAPTAPDRAWPREPTALERQKAEQQERKKRAEDNRVIANAMSELSQLRAGGHNPREFPTSGGISAKYPHTATAVGLGLVVLVPFPREDGLWAYPKDWRTRPSFTVVVGGSSVFTTPDEFEKKYPSR